MRVLFRYGGRHRKEKRSSFEDSTLFQIKKKNPVLSTQYKNTLRNVSNKKSKVEEYRNKIMLMKHGMHECRRKFFWIVIKTCRLVLKLYLELLQHPRM